MEPSESREPSYYEVALTNRQVLVAFVALLVCMLAAFLSGVWIGRGGATSAKPAPVVAQPASGSEPQLEQLTFFTGKEPGARTAVATPPPAAPVVPRPAATAPALPATRPAPLTTPTPAPPAPEVAVARATPTPARATAAPAATPAPTSAKPGTAKAVPPAAGKLYVQVYSSNNGARAKEIVTRLRKGGFKVQLTETPKSGSQTNYRVRVGPYDGRSEADRAASRLRREYRLDTWVTDTP